MWTAVLQDATYVSTFGLLAYAPSAGVWAASGLLAYSPQVGVRAAFPYYVLGCVFSMVLRNVIRYLLGCVTGRLCWFLLTTYPETMPLRIPVFSHPTFSLTIGLLDLITISESLNLVPLSIPPISLPIDHLSGIGMVIINDGLQEAYSIFHWF
jgi:hypothetical protein